MLRARERFELSLRVNPEAGVRPHTISGIGIAMLMQGEAEQAQTVLLDAFAAIPNDPITLAALAVTSVMVGDRETGATAARLLRTGGGTDQVFAVVQNPAHRAMLEAGLARAEVED